MTSKVLLRDDQDQPIAVTCSKCGKFCLDTKTCLCAGCSLSKLLQPFSGGSSSLSHPRQP